MKYVILLAFIVCSFLSVKGQANNNKPKDTTYIVTHDTINVRGVIYSYDGKPAAVLKIGFFPKGFHPSGFPTVTQTDINGNFELKGASIDDRLIIWDGRYSNVFYPINDSRFVAIYLPPARIGRAAYDTVRVTSVRKTPKVIPSFNVHDHGSSLFITYEVSPYPEIGQYHFMKLFKDSLVYPSKAVINNIEGLVEIGFQISSKGDPYDFVTLKGIGYGCEEQVIELIKKGGKWRLGIIYGKPYSIQQTVAVQFKLTDK